jgi:chromosome partitioning protein
MSHIIAIANQKGGVGKTTSTINIAAELALMGRRVLMIDLDPQGSATSGLGVEKHPEGQDIYDMFFQRVPLTAIVKATNLEGLSLVPSSRDLVGVEIELGKTPGRELILRTEIEPLKDQYDYVFVDCPPSSGLLTLNAMGAAERILIPLQAEYYALEGLSALLETIEFVKGTFNPELSILGVFITMFDVRTNLSAQVEDEARKYFGSLMFRERVPRSVRLSECPSHGLPICRYDPGSAGAKAYHYLAIEVDRRCFEKLGGRKKAANL